MTPLFANFPRLRPIFTLRTFAVLLMIVSFVIVPMTHAARRFERQDKETKKPETTQEKRKDENKVPDAKEIEKERKKKEASAAAQVTPAEAVAELAIYVFGGREQLKITRANFQEEGVVRLATEQGDIIGNYTMRSIMKEKSWTDLLRTDLELTPPDEARRQGAPETVKYTVAFNGASVWSAQNNQYVTPRPEADVAFRAQLVHDYLTLLRYREDGSKVELKDPETIVGVETNVLDLTLPDGTKTRYWISKKTFRILHCEYELKLSDSTPAAKYRISYYYTPQIVVQNTLVPSRKVMLQDGKFTQEMKVTTFTPNAKVDLEVFQHLQGQ